MTLNAQQLHAALDSGDLAEDALVLIPAVGDGQHQYGEGGYLDRGAYEVLTARQADAYHAYMAGRPSPMSRDDAARVWPAISVLWALRNEWENGGA